MLLITFVTVVWLATHVVPPTAIMIDNCVVWVWVLSDQAGQLSYGAHQVVEALTQLW